MSKENKKEQEWEARERLGEKPFDKPEQGDWEKELNKTLNKFLQDWRERGWVIADTTIIKSFISAQIQKSFQDGYAKGRIRCLEQHRGEELREAIEKALSQQREELAGKIAKMAMLNADSGWYDKAIRDVLNLIKPNTPPNAGD